MRTLVDGILGAHPSWEDHCDGAQLRRLAHNAMPHHAQLWELHTDERRIDLSAVAHQHNTRAMRSARAWLARVARADTAPVGPSDAAHGAEISHHAARLLHRLTRNMPDARSLYWEADAVRGGLGIFVCTPYNDEMTTTLNEACAALDLPQDRIETLHSLFSPSLPLHGLGCFVGRNTPRALRANARAVASTWAAHLPRALRRTAEDLQDALPTDTVITPVFQWVPDTGTTTLALEVRPRVQPDPFPSVDAWVDWLARAWPSMPAWHQCFVEDLQRSPSCTPWDAPGPQILLDAYARHPVSLPAIVGGINHMKIRRTSAGRLERKLYLRFDIAWLSAEQRP